MGLSALPFSVNLNFQGERRYNRKMREPHVPSPSIPFELDAMSKAKRYQQWIFEAVSPQLGNRIMELGAGLGNMSAWLPVRDRLILTEGDPYLVECLRKAFADTPHPDKIRIDSLDLAKDAFSKLGAENLDTVVSFNVLEHIEDDASVICSLAELLRQSNAAGPKRIVTFVPAHPWAYGEIDRSLGHFRRYSTEGIRDLASRAAPDARLEIRFFNLIGLGGWFWNSRIARRKQVGMSAIQAFEALCPYIKPIDNFIHKSLNIPLGQSVLFTLTWN